MAVQHEIKANEIQVANLKQLTENLGNADNDILIEAVKLEYDGARAFSNAKPNELITQGYVAILLAGMQFAFAAGVSTVTILNWDTLYAPTFGNGKFWVQILNAAGNTTDRYDVPIERIKDITGTFQVSVIFDFGLTAFAGQINIEYSNAPLL